MIMTGLVFHGTGNLLSSIYSLHLVMRPIPSVGSAREIQVKEVKAAAAQPHAERGRQLYRRVVALGNDALAGADVYFLRDRRRGNIRRYPKLVYALPHYEDREGFHQSLFWTTENGKLGPMQKRDLSLPFYNGLNLFVSSNRDRHDTQPVRLGFGRILLDASEDAARLTQQKDDVEGTEQETDAQSRRNQVISPACRRQANVLLQLSTCNAYHERRVGAAIDDDLSNDYLDLLLSRCDCMLLRS